MRERKSCRYPESSLLFNVCECFARVSAVYHWCAWCLLRTKRLLDPLELELHKDRGALPHGCRVTHEPQSSVLQPLSHPSRISRRIGFRRRIPHPIGPQTPLTPLLVTSVSSLGIFF